jgi:plastocyanin
VQLRFPLLTSFAALTLAVALASALAVALWPGTEVAAAQEPLVVAVDLNEWSINPRHVVAKAGQPVRFELTNTGAFNHSLSIEGQGQAWHSDLLASGSALNWNVTLSQPGIYQIWCPVFDGGHRDRGMIGTLVVVEPQEEPVLPVVVLMDEWWIQPLSAVTVAGQNTRFDLRNIGTANTHSITIVGQGMVLDSPAYAVGESGTWDVVLNTPGTYEVYCPRGNGSHRERGMVGTLEVLPGGRM